MIKLIVFDLDGTLIDSGRDLAQSVNLMRQSFNLSPLSIAEVIAMVGNGAKILVQRATVGTNVDFEEALKRQKKFYAEHLTDFTTLYPGVAEGLQALHNANVHLAVFSNKPSFHSEKILEHFQLSHLFDVIYGGDSPFPLKPAPDALSAIQNQFQFLPIECCMLGDHYTDMEAGRRAGFRRIFAKWGIGNAKTEVPDAIANSFSDFVQMVLQDSFQPVHNSVHNL